MPRSTGRGLACGATVLSMCFTLPLTTRSPAMKP